MSIISEALKKVQEARKSEKKTAFSLPEPQGPIPIQAYAGIVIAIIVIAVVAAYALRRPSAPNLAAKAAPQVIPSHQEVVYTPAEQVKVEEKSPPSPPQVASAAAPPELILNGIMCSEDRRYAIINNGITLEGDVVGGAKVEKIEPNKVFLKYSGGDIVLKLKK